MRRTRIGTRERLDEILNGKTLYKVNDNVYWDEKGELYIVANEEWINYLAGGVEEVPTQSDDTCFEPDKGELMGFLFGGDMNGS